MASKELDWEFGQGGRKSPSDWNVHNDQVPRAVKALGQEMVREKKTDKLRKFELKMDWSETRSMEMGC